MATQVKYGLQVGDPYRAGSAKSITGLHAAVDYERLKTESFEELGNPWQTDQDDPSSGFAEKSAWETTFATNTEQALAEYSDLVHKKYGYEYETLAAPQGPAALRTRALAIGGAQPEIVDARDIPGRMGMSRRYAQERGMEQQSGKYLAVRQQRGRDSSVSYHKIGEVSGPGPSFQGRVGPEVQQPTRSRQFVKGVELSDLEEYKLRRYEHQIATTDQAIGTGEIDYNFLDELGYTPLLKSGAGLGAAQRQRGPALGGGGIDRRRRQAGKTKYKTGLQL